MLRRGHRQSCPSECQVLHPDLNTRFRRSMRTMCSFLRNIDLFLIDLFMDSAGILTPVMNCIISRCSDRILCCILAGGDVFLSYLLDLHNQLVEVNFYSLSVRTVTCLSSIVSYSESDTWARKMSKTVDFWRLHRSAVTIWASRFYSGIFIN